MARKGKKLEQLVEFLESLELPGDAIVTSPDYIKDKDSGQLREVDISIRQKIGTVPLFIILECRDRTSAQGSPWVEEIIGKMKSVRADKAIMISSSGFSEPAKIKAKLNGIELRYFEEIDGTEIKSWFNVKILKMTYKRYEIESTKFDIFNDQKVTDKISRDLEKYRGIGATDKLFKVKSDGAMVSLNDIFWKSVDSMGEKLFQSFPVGRENSTRKEFVFNFTNRKECYQLVAGNTFIDIQKININAHCWRDLEDIPISRFFKYSQKDGEILYDGVEFKLKIDGNTKDLVIANIEDEAKEYRIISAKLIDDSK